MEHELSHSPMPKNAEIIASLRKRGYRITPRRKTIASAVTKTTKPFAALEMYALLKRKGVVVDKVTVYRELQFLEKQGVLQGGKFQDGIKRYCLTSNGHHHHLICTKCSDIQDVEMENDLNSIEKKIQKEKSFKIQSHVLEFYGLCSSCV